MSIPVLTVKARWKAEHRCQYRRGHMSLGLSACPEFHCCIGIFRSWCMEMSKIPRHLAVLTDFMIFWTGVHSRQRGRTLSRFFMRHSLKLSANTQISASVERAKSFECGYARGKSLTMMYSCERQTQRIHKMEAKRHKRGLTKQCTWPTPRSAVFGIIARY